MKKTLGCIVLMGCWCLSCTSSRVEVLTIATAANMQFAMNDLISEFTEQTEIPCEAIISSSGKLTAQIREGAPYDLLISADMKFPRELHRHQLTAFPPRVYAYGKLVLWTMKENLIPSLSVLQEDDIEHIAMANPKTAPYGQAALEVLERSGLLSALEKKFVFGESIAQTNQFIISQAADIGFTAKSVVLSPRVRDQGHWVEIEQEWYAPIEQGVVVLRTRAAQQEAARRFFDFLFSAEAREILQKFGYSVVE